MENIGYMPRWIFDIAGFHIVLNKETLIMTWIVMAFWILFSLLATKSTKMVPNPLQSTAEILIATWDDLVKDSLGLTDRRYFAFICTIFLLFWVSNLIGIIP